MLKRTISLGLALIMLLSLGGLSVFATEEAVYPQYDVETAAGAEESPKPTSIATPQATTLPSATPAASPKATEASEELEETSADFPISDIAGSAVTSGVNSTDTQATAGATDYSMRSFDGTASDGTLNNANGIRTNVVENSSKYNSMATTPINDQLAQSRYSTSRITLAPDISETKYAEAAELLGALGIMVGDAETGNFRPDDNILRSEMAKVGVYTVGLEDVAKSSQGPTKFPDVPADHWATGAINVADQQGIVVGDDVGTFRPDDSVLLQEAVAIVVRALGYEPAAADRGGYPAGYMYIASTNQLLKGIDATASDPAKRGDIAQLVFNALTVNMMEQTGFGSNASYQVVDKTLLYDRLNVEKGYGQVTSTSETSLTGDATTSRDSIKIDNNRYLIGDTTAKQMLGFNVLYYARIDKTSDEKTLIVIREQANKNRSVTINSDDIVNITGTDSTDKVIEYWADRTDKRTKTLTIQAAPTYIYNGKYKTDVTIDMLKPETGNLVLLDSDVNGMYDIVFVNHFTNLVVDTVSSVTGRVTDKYLNGSLVFDESDPEAEYTIIKDGAEITVGDLKEWNVISYTRSEDNLLVRAYVSDASITGTVTEISETGLRIGDSTERYKIAPSYPNDISLRDKGTFYLDISNKIAAVNTATGIGAAQGRNYAYLIGSTVDTDFETTARFKVFTKEGETVILPSASKIRYNTTYGMTPAQVVEKLKASDGTDARQMIIYELNSSGNVTAIETAKNGTSTGAPNVGEFTLNFNGDNVIYKSASNKLGNFTIGEDTLIFDIPADAGDDTDRFAVRNRSTLSNDASYDIWVYDLQENYTANVVVITNTEGVTAPESPLLLVDYISETQTEDFDYTDRLYGWQGGEQINLLASDTTVLTKTSGSKLSQGDIIQYKTNSRGEIDGITVLFDASDKSTEFINDVTTDLTTVYGSVTKKFGGSVNVSINGDIRNFATGDAIVYLYDSSKKQNNISVVSASDIEIYEEGNEARLFIKLYQDVVQEMVIVK